MDIEAKTMKNIRTNNEMQENNRKTEEPPLRKLFFLRALYLIQYDLIPTKKVYRRRTDPDPDETDRATETEAQMPSEDRQAFVACRGSACPMITD